MEHPRTNFKVFNDASNPLNIFSIPSTIIKYNQFSAAQTNTTLWTPASNKSIYLTAIQISSAGIGVTINLQRAGNSIFAVIILTTTINSYNANYFSPIKFNTNESISLTSTYTLTAGNLDITLFGFEQ